MIFTKEEGLPSPIESGECLVLETTEPVYETRTKVITLQEEYVEYVVVPASFETKTVPFEYRLGEVWNQDCCMGSECQPIMCYENETITGEREITNVTPATLTTIVHPAVIETIEYQYAIESGGAEWVSGNCATPKR